MRVQRSKDHDIRCTRLHYTDTSAVFTVVGTQGDVYPVEVAENLDLWPPTCACEDYVWRGPDFCVSISCSVCASWVSRKTRCGNYSGNLSIKKTLLDFLCNAPDVVGERTDGDSNAE